MGRGKAPRQRVSNHAPQFDGWAGPDTVVVYDTPNACWRNHFAHQGLARYSDGFPTGAVFGLLREILWVADALRTNRFAFAWDSKSSLRRKWYPQYKANRRHEKDDARDVHDQMKELRLDILPNIGFEDQFVQAGLEADDIIAKLVGSDPLTTWVVVSSDEDLYQVLYPNVALYKYSKGDLCTFEDVQAEYGIPEPYYYGDALALAGCSTDNIPGAPGVGVKSACKYYAGKPSPALIRKCEAAIDAGLVEVNWPLVKLPHPNTDPVRLGAEPKFDMATLLEVLEENEMHSMLDNIAPWERLFRGVFDAA